MVFTNSDVQIKSSVKEKNEPSTNRLAACSIYRQRSLISSSCDYFQDHAIYSYVFQFSLCYFLHWREDRLNTMNLAYLLQEVLTGANQNLNPFFFLYPQRKRGCIYILCLFSLIFLDLTVYYPSICIFVWGKYVIPETILNTKIKQTRSYKVNT